MELNSSCGSSFACNGQYFALLSIDNRLRIWDTISGKLIQEFSPSTDVESTCTCLCWTRDRESQSNERKRDKDGKKKHRKNKKEELKSSNNTTIPCIALGTRNGRNLLYDPIAGEVQGTYDHGHCDTVTCISFQSSTELLYTCSKDKFIIEWDYEKKVILSKWKADQNAVHMICLGPSGKTILSAGMSIKLWNLQTKELIMQFNGHTSPVTLLQFSDFRIGSKEGSNDDGYYFLSGSKEDRVINAWQINYSKHGKSSVAAYMLSDPPKFMNTIVLKKADKPLQLTVGCQDGKIYYFHSTLNGKSSRPIEHAKSIEICHKQGSKTAPENFLNGYLHAQDDVLLHLVNGPYMKPSFKEYNLTQLEKETKIVHEVSKNLLLKKLVDQTNETSEIANISKEVRVVRDSYGVMTFGTPNLKLDVNGNEEETSDVSMQERVEGLSSTENKAQKPSATGASFSQMIIQGLQSRDHSMMSQVFKTKTDDKVLVKTIERIPFNLIQQFLQLIVDELHKSPMRAPTMGKWIHTILSVHFTQLSSLTGKKMNETIGKLYSLLKDHEQIYSHLVKLQGKMDLLLSHADNIAKKNPEVVVQSAVIFNDDSDSDDDDDEMIFNEMEDDNVYKKHNSVDEEKEPRGKHDSDSDVDSDEVDVDDSDENETDEGETDEDDQMA